MNPSYRQTFNRHRVLFSLPIAITTLLAIWFVAGSPKEYKAGASLYVDTRPPGASSLNDTNPSTLTQAAKAQQLLTELLATKRFRLEIGHKGPLASYMATHPSQGWGPTGLLKKARGGSSVDDRTAAALDPKHVLMTLPGPQILGIEFLGPSPAVAVGTLRALVDTFNNERRDLDVSRQQLALSIYKNRADTARARVAQINSKIAAGNLGSAEIQGLAQARASAETQLRSATRAYNTSALALATAKAEKGPYQVIDEPSLPAPATSGMKKSVMMVVAGMFVGFLISLLAVVLLTSTESRPAQDELRDVVAQAHDDPVPLDLDSVKTTNGNGSGAHQDAPTKAEHEKRAG